MVEYCTPDPTDLGSYPVEIEFFPITNLEALSLAHFRKPSVLTNSALSLSCWISFNLPKMHDLVFLWFKYGRRYD